MIAGIVSTLLIIILLIVVAIVAVAAAISRDGLQAASSRPVSPSLRTDIAAG